MGFPTLFSAGGAAENAPSVAPGLARLPLAWMLLRCCGSLIFSVPVESRKALAPTTASVLMALIKSKTVLIVPADATVKVCLAAAEARVKARVSLKAVALVRPLLALCRRFKLPGAFEN